MFIFTKSIPYIPVKSCIFCHIAVFISKVGKMTKPLVTDEGENNSHMAILR